MNYQENSVLETFDRNNNKVETIRQLAKRHMMDQYHTTTDEELKNAVVESDIEFFPEFKPASTVSRKNE